MPHDSYTSKGIRYDGQFVNGSYHGQGKFTFGNGDVYDGLYDSGVRHGTGTYVSRHAHSRSPVRVTRELHPIRGWGEAHTSVWPRYAQRCQDVCAQVHICAESREI